MDASNTNRFAFRLNLRSGVPVYRQIIDRVHEGIASGALQVGDQLPTVRQLAVDLAINPNTVIRAYRELEMLGMTESHQGSGTFVRAQGKPDSKTQRRKRLQTLASEVAARAGEQGFTLTELIDELNGMRAKQGNGSERS